MQFMWADTLRAAERAHLLRGVLWGGSSVLIGASLLVLLRIGRDRSPLLVQFGIQTTAWGTLDLLLAGTGLRFLSLRDFASATRLDRFLWLNLGLDVGYVLVGLTLLVVGWRVARRPGLIGAGLGVVVQGSALAVLNLVFAAQITR